MKKIILMSALAIVSSQAQSTVVNLYDLNFESTVQPYGINFGSPTIEAAGLDGNSLVFNANTSTYEQIELGMGYGFNQYNISFDVLTNGLVGSDYNFALNVDTPQVQNLNLHGSVGLSTFNPGESAPADGGIFGSFVDNQRMRVDINVDIANSLWTVDVDNGAFYSGPFYASGSDITSLRFGLSPWIGGAVLDPNVSVALDNVVVTASVVPVPAAVWLFVSGLLGLLGFSSRKRL